jgi:hypothetical protein
LRKIVATLSRTQIVTGKAARIVARLFFNESDAFFGKRTSRDDAKACCANQEVSYFLQRLEDYVDTSLLAMNFAAPYSNRVALALSKAYRISEEMLRGPATPSNAPERVRLWRLYLHEPE